MPSTVLLGAAAKGREERAGKGTKGEGQFRDGNIWQGAPQFSIRSHGTNVCLIPFFPLPEMTVRRVKVLRGKGMHKHKAKCGVKQSNWEFSLKPSITFVKTSWIKCQLFKVHYPVCGLTRLPPPFSTVVLAILLLTGPLSLRDQEGKGRDGSQLQVFVLHLASGPTHICGLETHLYHLKQ